MRSGIAVVAVVLAAGCLAAEESRPLRIGTTTSLHDPGLDDHLLARYIADTGVRAVAVVAGSGEVLEKARRGDLDAVLVHHPEAEAAFVAAGAGRSRAPFLANDFVLVGPRDDPAGVADSPSAAEAFARIAAVGAPFASRGDGSGTHARELELWDTAGVEPSGGRFETGSGQAATLAVADARRAYALADEATWIALDARGRVPRLALIPLNDPALENVYSIVISTHSSANGQGADAFARWLTGPGGRDAIAAFLVEGRAVFRSVEVAS